MKHALYKIYALTGYAASMAALTYYFGWLSGLFVLVSVNGPALIDLSYGSAIAPLVANMLLMALFMVPHSGMARPGFKKRWLSIVPKPIERATYCWYSALTMFAMMLLWQPIAGELWTLPGTMGSNAVYGLYILGILILVGATFCIDHFELFGLKQAFVKPGQKVPAPEFMTRGLYKLVRHPIALGHIIIVWSAPVMTFSHLLYATVSSVYVLYVTFKLEEPDLIYFIGEDYKTYKKATPAIFPFKLKR